MIKLKNSQKWNIETLSMDYKDKLKNLKENSERKDNNEQQVKLTIF